MFSRPLSRMTTPTSIAIFLGAAFTWFNPAVAQTAIPSQQFSTGSGEMILGCWAKVSTGPEDRDYWSMCFQSNGQVDSTVISGSPGTGLGGTASGGLYEITERQIRFSFDAGDYGWLWESGSVLCNFALDDDRLAFTQCYGNEPDMSFERAAATVE